MYIKNIITALLIIFLFSGTKVSAQNIPTDPSLRTGRLPNGFTYYIRANTEPNKRAYMYLINNVGSLLEDEDQLGLAHFMEHMNFNGTRNFPRNELVNYLQLAGVRFGADLNAHTGLDETVYELPIPTEDPTLIANGLKIMRDWAQEAILDPAEINKERGVILEEGRLAKGAKDRMSRQYMSMLLNGSRYASRFPIGRDSILINFKPEVIQRFFQDWYRPDLQALIVVGDIDVDAIENAIKKNFSDLRVPRNKRTRETYPIALRSGKHFLSVTDPEMTGTTLEVIYKQRSPELKTEKDYLEMLKRSLLADLISTRRYVEISRQSNPAYTNISLGIQPLMGGVDIFVLDVSAKEGQVKDAFVQSWQILEKIKRFGFSESELTAAKRNYLRRIEGSLNETGKTPSINFVNEYKNLYLQGVAAPGIQWESDFTKKHISDITAVDIQDILKKYLNPDNFDVLLLAPEKDKAQLADSSTVYAWIKDIAVSKIEPFKEETAAISLMPVQPKSGKIVSKKELSELGITELILSNGMRVVLKPTEFKNDQVLFKGTSAGGTSLYNDSDYDNAVNAAPLMSRFGLAELNPVQLNNALNGKVINVYASILPRTQTISGGSSVADLETALQVAHLQMTTVRRDETIFRNIINSTKEGLALRANDPVNVFSDTIAFLSGNRAFRYAPVTPERMDQINLDKVLRIYKDRFSDASGFTFVFVGKFDQEKLLPLIERYLASLPATYSKEQARDLGIHLPNGIITKKVYAGSENKATIRMIYSGDYKYSPENNTQLKALGDILQIKVLQRLRETEGEVYSPSVQVSNVKNPRNRYSITISFGCAPENTEHLMKAVKEEMAKMKQNGITEDDLLKFKSSYSKNVELALHDNGFWLNYIAGQYENEEPLDEVSKNNEILNGVTIKGLNRAAQFFLAQENILSFILLPKSMGNQK